MICPWLKNTTSYKSSVRDETYEEYCGCYGDKCPWYRPEYNEGEFIVKEECKRVKVEWDKAKGGGTNAD